MLEQAIRYVNHGLVTFATLAKAWTVSFRLRVALLVGDATACEQSVTRNKLVATCVRNTMVSSVSLWSICNILHAQPPLDYYEAGLTQNAIALLEECLGKASKRASSGSDANDADMISALRLSIDLHPADRHRFLLPRPIAVSRLNADRIRNLFDTKEGWTEFRTAFETLVDLTEKAISRSESKRDWEAGYRLRWRLAGMQSMMPKTLGDKQTKRAGWSHSEALESTPEVRKAYTNHPKTLWPAGSYTVATTPHFEIASQSEIRATSEVAVLCEQAFALWKQVFFQAWANKQVVAPEYAETLDHKFSVVLFRNRDAYAKALRSIKDIGQSTGYYDPNQKIALFYWDGVNTQNTVVHELTHQFFFEANAQPVALDTDRGSGFWVVEGVALYMESMSTRACGGSWIADVGGWDSPRLQAGRYRRLHDKYWVPWEYFHTADGRGFRSEEDIRAWYSQAAGLAHLWLDGSVERRQSFEQYVESVYANKEDPKLLGEWNDDKSLRDALDRFLIHGPSTAGGRPYFANRREAVLSRSRITAQQLLDWPVEYRTTPRLDLSFTQVDDGLFVAGDRGVGTNWNVQRLNLESTKVTDACMMAIADNKNLSELDLSNCSITDVGLAALTDHKSLKSLWLNQCDVTDASIGVLLSISQLEAVHLSKSKVSPRGWDRLLVGKPRLKSKSTGP